MKLKTKVCLGLILITILLLPIVIYGVSFNGYELSKDNQDWGGFGSYLSGVYTLLSSLASLATLIFLLVQYYSQKDTQLRLASAQLEVISFQKYQAHYQQFLQLTDSVEQDERYSITFMNKGLLYKSLFPNNGFSQCEYDTQPEDSNYIINDLNSLISKLKEDLSSTEVSAQKAERIVSTLSMIFDTLFIKLNRAEKEGDIVFQIKSSSRYVILNSEDLQEVSSNLWAVLDLIYHFCGSVAPEDLTYQIGTSFNVDSMARYKDFTRGRTQGYFFVGSEGL